MHHNAHHPFLWCTRPACTSDSSGTETETETGTGKGTETKKPPMRIGGGEFSSEVRQADFSTHTVRISSVAWTALVIHSSDTHSRTEWKF